MALNTMTSPVNHVSASDGKDILWQCLNADATTEPGTAEDLISLENVVGLDFWSSASSGFMPTYRATTSRRLSQEGVEEWIKEPTSTDDDQASQLCGKILVGDQILEHELSHPVKEGVQFSRSQLSKSFNLPPIALERLSCGLCWYLEFCRPRYSDSVVCEGLGTVFFSFVVSFDEKLTSTRAVIVFHGPADQTRRDAQARMMQEFEILGPHFMSEPAFVPYLILNLFMRMGSRRVYHFMSRRLETDKTLEKMTHEPETLVSNGLDISITSGIHERACYTGGIRLDAANSAKMAKKWLGQLMKKPETIADCDWPLLKARKAQLRDCLDVCEQVFQNMAEAGTRSEEHASRQMSQTSSMLAYAQQKLSRRGQEVGLVVAETAKEDGYAMKGLALVATVFLPATFVAAVLSMPLFDWEAKENVVSPRIWVYFLVTIPLTALTVAAWWLWNRRSFLSHRRRHDGEFDIELQDAR